MTDRGEWADYLAGESSGLDLPEDERTALDRIGRHLSDEGLWEAPASDGQFRLLAAAAAEAGQLSDPDTGPTVMVRPDQTADPAPPADQTSSPPSRAVEAAVAAGSSPATSDDHRTTGMRPMASVPAAGDEDDGVIAMLDRRRDRRQRASWFGAGAVVAAAAAAIALVATGRLGDLSTDAETDTEVAITSYDLVATELDPDTVAAVDVKPTVAGVEFWLNLKGLDNTEGPDYYAAWQLDDSGDVIPLGSFHWRAGGIPIILWGGVEDSAYNRFMITRQVQGDGGVRSDQVVLMGEIDGLTQAEAEAILEANPDAAPQPAEDE